MRWIISFCIVMESWSHTCHFETKIISYDHIFLNFQLLEVGITEFNVFSAQIEQKYHEYSHFPLIQKYFTPFIYLLTINVSEIKDIELPIILRSYTIDLVHYFGKYLLLSDFSVKLPKILLISMQGTFNRNSINISFFLKYINHPFILYQ